MITTAPKAATSESTRIYKGLNGWTGTTNTTDSGDGWKITTVKGYSGKISSSATAGQFDGLNFMCSPMTAKKFDLGTVTGSATEKAIREQHAKALILFDELVKDEPAAYIIKVGQKINFIGYDSNERPELVIYNIKAGGFGPTYETINERTKELGSTDRLDDLENRFGIGHYYIKDLYFEDLNELNNLVIEAKQAEAAAKQAASIKADANAIERAAKIEEGKKIVKIPAGAVSVIVAELMQDDSDSQSDYFNSHSTKTVYLAFSEHKKDLFAEMRKACLNCDIEGVLKFATAPEVDNNGETKAAYIESMKKYYKEGQDAGKDWHPADENRQKYSGGSGYNLGAGSYASGWRITKESYINLQACEDLFIAATENRYFCNNTPEPTPAPAANFEKVEIKAGEVQIIDYSEKAIAVIGDTKPIKDQLKEIGGKFNFRLSCGAGWIFSKKLLPEVEALLSGSN